MRTYNSDNYKKIAILGSFSKHYDLIVDVSKKFILWKNQLMIYFLV